MSERSLERAPGLGARLRSSPIVGQAAAVWATRVLFGILIEKLAFIALPTGASFPRDSGLTVDRAIDATGKSHSILVGLLHWDAFHYLQIAHSGYPHAAPGDDTHALAAFFPLYPMLVRAVAFVLPVGADRYRYAALVVSWSALLAAVLGIMLVTRELVPRGDAVDAAIAFAWFPASVFLIAGYTEALFTALMAWALYAFVKQRYLALAILCGLIAGTRLQGGVLVILVVWPIATHQLRVVKGVLLCVVAEAGLIAYAAFCWWRYGTPLAFLHAQKFWHRHFTWPLHPILAWARAAAAGHAHPGNLNGVFLLDSVVGLLGLAGAVTLVVLAVRHRLPMPIALVAAVLVFLNISTGPYGRSPEAMARFTMVIVPLYFVVSIIMRRAPAARTLLYGTAALAALFQVVFTLGYWFT